MIRNEEEILWRIFDKKLKPWERICAHRVLEWCAENPYRLIREKKEGSGDLLDVLEDVVQEMYGKPFSYFMMKDRRRPIVDVRHRALKIYHEMSGKPVYRIAKQFGFNHTSLLYAFRNVQDLCETDEDYRREYEEMKRKIHERCES